MGAGSQQALNLNVNCNSVDKLFPFSKVVSLERWKMSWILYCIVFRAIDLSGSKLPANPALREKTPPRPPRGIMSCRTFSRHICSFSWYSGRHDVILPVRYLYGGNYG